MITEAKSLLVYFENGRFLVFSLLSNPCYKWVRDNEIGNEIGDEERKNPLLDVDGAKS